MGTNRFFRSDIPASLRSRLQRAGSFLALACSLLLAGCVTTEPYRNKLYPSPSDTSKELVGKELVCIPTDKKVSPQQKVCDEEKKPDCACQVYYTVSESTKDVNTTHLAIVEFDDQGYLQNDKLVRETLRRIKALAREKPLLMVVFAHGWKNNAEAGNGNLEEFSRELQRIALGDRTACSSDDSKCHNREVVGVYLGWRGLATNIEPFNLLSFWQRKNRAHRVGIDGASQIISALGAIRKQNNDKDEANGEHGHTRLILVGHSFGAALMYSATQQLLLRDLAYTPDGEMVKNDTADLVVLVNPAFEAARVHTLWLAASDRKFPPEQHPLLAVFTSVADWETGFMFPLGRRLSTFWMPQTADRVATDARSASNQRAENAATVGKYEPWQTHLLKKHEQANPADASAISQVSPTDTESLFDTARSWESFQHNSEMTTWSSSGIDLVRCVPVGGKCPEVPNDSHFRNPYLFIKVDKDIITGHTGIWGCDFSNFLYKFIAVQSAVTKGKQVVKEQPDYEYQSR